MIKLDHIYILISLFLRTTFVINTKIFFRHFSSNRFYFPAHQSCDDFRDGSDTSSHVTSPLSPRVPPPPNNGHHFPPFMNGVGGGVPPHQAVNTIQGVNPLQMQAGMYPPFRMNGQPPNNSGKLKSKKNGR